MISTFAQVRDRVIARLDDPLQQTFTDAIVLPGIQEAVDALQGALVFFEIPKSKVVTTYTLPVGTQTLTPATAGISNCGEIIELRERLSGSSDRYTHVDEVDDLPQRDATDRLGQWEWRGDAFWFVGATSSRQLWISYFSTTQQPTAIDDTPTGVDGNLNFLSLYTIGAIGGRKGYDEIAAQCRVAAVGSRYDDGIIGGELFRLAQPMVRSRQRVQVAAMPYAVGRRLLRNRRAPYIAAGQAGGSGGSTAPIEFSSATGTITGTIDGVNPTFFISFPVSSLRVTIGGAWLTSGVDYTHAANVITFLSGSIPQAGNTITAEGWL